MMEPTASSPLVDKVRSRLFEAIRVSEEQANKQFFASLSAQGPIENDAQRAGLIRGTVDSIRRSLMRLRNAGLGPNLYRRKAFEVLNWWSKRIETDPLFADIVAKGKRGRIRTTLRRILQQMYREVGRDAQQSKMTVQGRAEEKVAETISNLVKAFPLMNVIDFALNLLGKQSASSRINQALAKVFGKLGFGRALATGMGAAQGRLTTFDIEEFRQQQETSVATKETRAAQWAQMREAEEAAPAAFAPQSMSPLKTPARAAISATPAGAPASKGRGKSIGGAGNTDMLIEAIFMVYDSLEKTIYPAIHDIYAFMTDARADDLREKSANETAARLRAEAAPMANVSDAVGKTADSIDDKTSSLITQISKDNKDADITTSVIENTTDIIQQVLIGRQLKGLFGGGAAAGAKMPAWMTKWAPRLGTAGKSFGVGMLADVAATGLHGGAGMAGRDTTTGKTLDVAGSAASGVGWGATLAGLATLLGVGVSAPALIGAGAIAGGLYGLYKLMNRENSGSNLNIANTGANQITGASFSDLTVEQQNQLLDRQAIAEGWNAQGGKNAPRRANNPGAILLGPFARRHGATGGIPVAEGKTLAVFPNFETGRAAQRALWNSKGYRSLPLPQALSQWHGTDTPNLSAQNYEKQVLGSISQSNGSVATEIPSKLPTPASTAIAPSRSATPISQAAAERVGSVANVTVVNAPQVNTVSSVSQGGGMVQYVPMAPRNDDSTLRSLQTINALL